MLCDFDPLKRWAARMYWQATRVNYSALDLINSSDTSEKALWVALEWKNRDLRGVGNTDFFTIMTNRMSRLADDLGHIHDPRLALLVSLQWTRELKDASFLDDVIRGHSFSEKEIASIQPDLYWMARESTLVRDKLLKMNLEVPDLSPERLHELERTICFMLVPEAKE
jgi:hypothetical protein